MNDDALGTYNINSQIKFRATLLKLSLYDYSDAYILVKGTITITGAGSGAAARNTDKRNKQLIFKNFAPFNHCIKKINNTQVDNAKGLIVVMPMYNVIEQSNDYAKTSRIL